MCSRQLARIRKSGSNACGHASEDVSNAQVRDALRYHSRGCASCGRLGQCQEGPRKSSWVNPEPSPTSLTSQAATRIRVPPRDASCQSTAGWGVSKGNTPHRANWISPVFRCPRGDLNPSFPHDGLYQRNMTIPRNRCAATGFFTVDSGCSEGEQQFR